MANDGHIQAGNVYERIPAVLPEELSECLAAASGTRILRIVSWGHATPPGAWYDQADTEWVLLLQGHATLRFESEGTRTMRAGDYLLIPAGCRHRVEWTSTDPPAVWVAVHFAGS